MGRGLTHVKRTNYVSYKTSYGTLLEYSLVGSLLAVIVGVAAILFIVRDYRYRQYRQFHQTEIWLDAPFSKQYKSTPLRDVLDSICTVKSCKWRVDGSQIIIEVP